MNLKKWIASCYANKNEINCKRLRGFKTCEEKILLTFDCARTFVAGKSSRSSANIASMKLSAWLQKNANYDLCTKNSKLHGIWWTSSGCSKSFHSHSASEKKVTRHLNNKSKLSKKHYIRRKKWEILNVVNHLVGKTFVLCSE